MEKKNFSKRLKPLFLLLLVFCVAVYPARPVWAAAGEDGFTYHFDTGGHKDYVMITYCEGYGSSTTIPDHYEYRNYYGYYVDVPVQALWSDVFSRCPYLKSVTITIDQEMAIDTHAFTDCGSLEEIIAAPRSWYESRDGVLYNEGKTELIRCPEGKTGYVSIPSWTETIDRSAFYQCSKLTGIDIPNRVRKIGSTAFYGCESLTSIFIPSGVAQIGEYAFENCTNMTDVYFECSKEEAANIKYTYIYGGKEYQIPFGDSSADVSDNIISQMRLPENVRIHYDFDPYDYQYTTLDDGTAELTRYTGTASDLSIPAQLGGKKLTSIGSDAFSGNSRLVSVSVPDGVTNIADSAFSGCTGLTWINIPKSVTNIGYGTFDGCTSLQVIQYAGNESQWFWDIKNSEYIDTEVSCCCCPYDYTSKVLADGTAEITGYTGNDTQITVPAWMDGMQVTSIGESAFTSLGGLTDLGIPGSITNIGANAFSKCTGLKNIHYSGSKKQWRGIAVAAGNDPLEHASIEYADKTEDTYETYTVSFHAWGVKEFPSQTVSEYGLVTDPGTPARSGYTFLGWYHGETKWDFAHDKVNGNMTLEAKWEDEEKVTTKKVNGRLEMVDAGNFVIIPLDKEFILDSSGFGAYSTYKGTTWSADSGNISLSSASGRSITIKGVTPGRCTIKSSITTEYWWYLAGSSELTLFDVDTTTVDYKYRVVSYVTSVSADPTMKLKKNESRPLSYTTVPEGNYARTLSGFRFSSSDTGVATVSADGIVTAKGNGTARITAATTDGFDGATCMATCVVTVGDSEEPGKPGTETPKKGTVLSLATESYKVTKAGAEVSFAGTTGEAASITIPATVTIKGISYKVTSVDAKALKGNKKIKKITVGKNVTSVGNKAFYGCSKLGTVNIKSQKLTSVGKNAFKGIKSTATIKVPQKKLKEYKKLLKGKGQGAKVTIKTI